MVSRSRRGGRVALLAFVLCLGPIARAVAQSGVADIERRGRIHGGARPPRAFYDMVAGRPGAFDFKRGLVGVGRAVARNRQALRSRGAFRLLNAPAGAVAATVPTSVSGTLRYPTLIPLFKNTSAADSGTMDSVPKIQSKFWGTAAAPPYSITTYYKEISGNRLTVTGTVINLIRVSQKDSFYSGGPNCQGLCPTAQVDSLIREMLHHADSTVDFSQFADSTGHVPAVVILDPQIGAECHVLYPPSIANIWSHRFSLSGWVDFRTFSRVSPAGPGPYTTNDVFNGHPVVIDDYIIEGGEGQGPGAQYGEQCTPGGLAPIGTVTHETGHLYGLPDLYDTRDLTEGIGRWDLMSSGNEQKPSRPAHMSAWSLSFLGWIAEVPVTTSQTVVVASPIEVSATAYVVPAGMTPDKEYFLIENRQRIGSDSMMYGPGLMIYHTDDVLMSQRLFNNEVNALMPHALWVVEADGNHSLFCAIGSSCWNRGDAGDPWPGSTNNTRFSVATIPPATKNSGAPAPVTIDSIVLAPYGAMSFRVTFGFQVVATTAGTGTITATRTLDPVTGALLAEGDSVTLTAVPGAGQSFLGWTGDTTAGPPALKLRMTRPFAVTATFAATADVVNRLLTGGGPLTPAALQLLDQLGNNNGRFDLGDFVAWLDRNPGVVSPSVVARLLRSVRR